MFQKIIDKFVNFYLYLADAHEPEMTEENRKKILAVPDFNDMIHWTKLEIDEHAEQYGIYLDRRKRKDVMINQYRAKYAKWVENHR